MSDLIAMAFACDQTRVFSMLYTGSVGGTVFWQVGADSGHHDLTHNEAGDQPLVQASTVFTMKQFAILLGALKATPEGAGNLLDSSVIMASSDTADGHDHSINDYPSSSPEGGAASSSIPGSTTEGPATTRARCSSPSYVPPGSRSRSSAIRGGTSRPAAPPSKRSRGSRGRRDRARAP
jgi:hypothetical protein